MSSQRRNETEDTDGPPSTRLRPDSSKDQLNYCSICQSTLYCSQVGQGKDWKKQHKKICKLLNVGHGEMQVRTVNHTRLSPYMEEVFERGQRSLDEDGKRFFKLFEESTFERSQAAARKMEKIAKRQAKETQKYLSFLSLYVLFRSDSTMLSWRTNSPLFVLLQFVDLNMLSGDALQEGGTIRTPLHDVADMAAPRDYLIHKNQLILAKQLFELMHTQNTTQGVPESIQCRSFSSRQRSTARPNESRSADHDPLGSSMLCK
jgi:hypothetical protein